MEYKDYYKILGIPRESSQEEIKRAYRKLARKYHPDVSKEKNAEQHFKEIKEAYEALKDSKKRAAYDQLGNHWQTGEEFQPPPDWNFGFEFRNSQGTSAADFSDFFESLFGTARSQHTQDFTHQNTFTHTGEDQQVKLAITLEEAYHGSQRRLQLQIPETERLGKVVSTTRTLDVKIPPGVTEGQKIRLTGQGQPGRGSGVPGDLYLVIELKPHRCYRCEGHDIYLTLPITPWEAALGGVIEVPTLGGKVELKITAGAQSGQKMRLKGRGFPGQPVGDQYVILQIMTPPAKTEAAKSFYQQMARQFSFNPRSELMKE